MLTSQSQTALHLASARRPHLGKSEITERLFYAQEIRVLRYLYIFIDIFIYTYMFIDHVIYSSLSEY